LRENKLGALVGTTLCTHVPRLLMPESRRAQYMGQTGSSFFTALTKMAAEKIEPLKIDTFVLFDTHWWTTLDFLIDARLHHRGRYTSDEIPEMIFDYDFAYEGDPELAQCIENAAKKCGVPAKCVSVDSLPYHYPTLVPTHYLNSQKRIRVLPMSVSYTSNIEDELKLGKAISNAIRDSHRKVVLIASGGLSHRFSDLAEIRSKATKDVSNIPPANRAWDEKIITWLKAGDHAAVIEAAHEFRREASPEGRFAHYLRMAGALGGSRCRLKGQQFGDYEAAVGTGQVIMWFDT
jgi:3,4-dihydroxyphenylacetate 2,3-dioxygenase